MMMTPLSAVTNYVDTLSKRAGYLLLMVYTGVPAAATVSVQDVVSFPDGTAFVGELRVAPCSSNTLSSCSADEYFTVPISNGYLAVDLSPAPRSRFFYVQYRSRDQRVQWDEQWALPAKGMPWQVAELRVNGQSAHSDGADPRIPRNGITWPDLAAPMVRGIDRPPVPA